MYHPTEMANTLTPTSWFYSLYLHTPERYNDNDLPPKLEISFVRLWCFNFSIQLPYLYYNCKAPQYHM